MAMKEICIDCLCLQLLAIRKSVENPQKVVELVNELLEEYDDIRPTQVALDEGDSPAFEDDTSPKVLSAGQAGSTPALRQ